MSHSERRLSPRQTQALMSLVAGDSVAGAARDAGVSSRQVWRWLRDEHFKSALQTEEGYLMQSLRLRLSALIDKAMDALEDVIDHPDQRGANVKRLSAVSCIELLLKVREAGVLEDRVSALEDAIKARGVR